jgi:hypothetical protein
MARGSTLFVAGAALLVAPAALAADRVSECVAAHADGQLLKNQGRLLAAKVRFTECRAESCPALVREECLAFEQSVDQALPSVVGAALDEHGNSTSEATLSVDGSTPAPLDGRTLTLDPGRHHFVFQRADGQKRELDVVLSESERERRVLADFRPPPSSATTSSEHGGARAAVFVSAGVAALALGSFTYFGLSGRAIQSDLDRCKPNCQNRDDLDRMQARYLAADISLGAALVSLGVGALIWANNPGIFSHAAAPQTGLAISVGPGTRANGVELSARGRF